VNEEIVRDDALALASAGKIVVDILLKILTQRGNFNKHT
jgi:hypothetical protein